MVNHARWNLRLEELIHLVYVLSIMLTFCRHLNKYVT